MIKMALRATKPVNTLKRLKMFVFAPPEAGKTTMLTQFPNNYIFDLEHGTDFYADTINKSNSEVFHTNNPDEIFEETKELLTTKHRFTTVSFDPVTQYYNAVQEKWTRLFVANASKGSELQDFGPRYWGRVKSEMKAWQRMLLNLDMNIIVTAHQKDVYGQGMVKLGVSFDSMKGDDYFFDYVFRLDKVNGKRMAYTVKERAEVGKNKFPESFEWSYEAFKKFYGAEIMEKSNVPVEMASEEDVIKLKGLLDVVKIDQEVINKWLTAADSDSFDQFTKEQITKCIENCEKRLKGVK
jgi:GTPase SAR1 family protein